MSLYTAILAALAITGATAQGNDPKSVGQYKLLGCYNDTYPLRALTGDFVEDDMNMSVEYCHTYCAGYKYFGLEYSTQSVSTIRNHISSLTDHFR